MSAVLDVACVVFPALLGAALLVLVVELHEQRVRPRSRPWWHVHVYRLDGRVPVSPMYGNRYGARQRFVESCRCGAQREREDYVRAGDEQRRWWQLATPPAGPPPGSSAIRRPEPRLPDPGAP